MASPAFIYAFDNLGPYRFTELCGVLLGSRYKGFVLGGVGKDGGVDAEIDPKLQFGEWQPETADVINDEIIQPGEVVIFQFKHKTLARIGAQNTARSELLNMYKCTGKKKCELHGKIISGKKLDKYILVTNVEVNSFFREKFIINCKQERNDITHFQVIGLDELESWVMNNKYQQHLYFPTLFGEARFNLDIQLQMAYWNNQSNISYAFSTSGYGPKRSYTSLTLEDFEKPFAERSTAGILTFFVVIIRNTGLATSYIRDIDDIRISTIIDGNKVEVRIPYENLDAETKDLSAPPHMAIEPGCQAKYLFRLTSFKDFKDNGKEIFPFEINICDEIGNSYSKPIPEKFRDFIIDAINK